MTHKSKKVDKRQLKADREKAIGEALQAATALAMNLPPNIRATHGLVAIVLVDMLPRGKKPDGSPAWELETVTREFEAYHVASGAPDVVRSVQSTFALLVGPAEINERIRRRWSIRRDESNAIFSTPLSGFVDVIAAKPN